MTSMMLAGGSIYTEDAILKGQAITIQNDQITAIQPKQMVKDGLLEFPASYHILPGFIDLHVHGANNHDVMDGTWDALAGLSKALATEGITGYLATTMTAPLDQIERALSAVHDYLINPALGAALLGVHLEGPFISAKKAGAQAASAILKPDSHLIATWQKAYAHIIKLVTLAPEEPNSLELIRYLRDHHIIASLGHTDATYAEAKQAINEGCHYVTHLFNAMRGLHQREPGVVTAALLSDKVTAELIVDGVHLHQAIVQLALKLKGLDRLVLVTDAMRAKCLGQGVYDLGGQAVHVEAGVATLADGTLAGSVLRMPDAMRHMMHFTDCTLHQVMKLVSVNPAKILGLFASKGSIAVGKKADIVVLDDDFCVVMTIVDGQIVYQVN